MNYCSIQEAWEKTDYITNQYKTYNNRYNVSDNPKNTLEKFSSNENQKIPKNPKNHIKNINKCDDFLSHLNKCTHCQRLLKNKYRPKILENFSDILDTNKDIVVLILIGICIMLFFNLVNSVTK